MRPMAHIQHASSRAVAQFATHGFLFLACRCRRRSTRRFVALAAWFSIESGTSGEGAFFLFAEAFG